MKKVQLVSDTYPMKEMGQTAGMQCQQEKPWVEDTSFPVVKLQVESVVPLEKGRIAIKLDNGSEFTLYRTEARKLALREGTFIPETLYQEILHDIIGIRVKKRAMHLLERMDRTEHQLFEKLKASGYPEECIENAINYVKSYHYIDDLRYAKTYVRCQQQKKSYQRLKIDLLQKGVAKDTIQQALEEEFVSDECEKIQALLQKRRYNRETADRKEQQRMYQFLLRRGFQSGDILKVLHLRE